VAGILMGGVSPAKWRDAIVVQNILQKRNPSTAKRLASLVRSRLEPMGEDLWTLVKNGNKEEAIHAVLAAVVTMQRRYDVHLSMSSSPRASTHPINLIQDF
jgi:hypothetical protein